MAIFHDCYLFDPGLFAQEIAAVRDLSTNSVAAYTAVRKVALNLLDSDRQVRTLAAEYGGWDKASIIADFGEDNLDFSAGAAFYLTLVLYSTLQTNSISLGIGHSNAVRDLHKLLTSFRWEELEQRLFINGRSFAEFPRQYFNDATTSEDKLLDSWGHIGTFSTSAHAGWLSNQEARLFHEKLIASLSDYQQSNLPNSSLVSYRAALNMVEAARKVSLGLFIVQSG